jgi:hypothetical protein
MKYVIFCPIYSEIGMQQILVKLSNFKFNENPFNGYQVVACIYTAGQGNVNRCSIEM